MPRNVVVIGAPWCEGQNLEGADLAPIAMRDAGLQDAIESLDLTYTDLGDINFSSVSAGPTNHYSVDLYRQWLHGSTSHNFATWMRRHSNADLVSKAAAPSASDTMGNRKRSFDDALAERSALNIVNAKLMGRGLKLVHDAVTKALALPSPGATEAKEDKEPPFVLTIGGDHSIASGSISALIAKHPDLGVIWVDAHADANTPRSSPSGHYHGMPAAHLLGWFDKPGEMGEGVAAGAIPGSIPGFEWFRSGCLAESKLAYIGLRDVDPEEARMLRKSGVRVFTMRDVDKHGIARVIEMAVEAVGPAMDNPLHISLDVDSIDPHFAPGTGTAARGGLHYREIHYICEELALTRRLVSMDLVEVNPGLDPPPEGGDGSGGKGEGLEDQPGGQHHTSGGAMHGDHPAIKRASPTVRLAVELVLSALGKTIC